MIEVGAYEAKTHLPRLLERVANGERITITKHGVPIAILIPVGDQCDRSAVPWSDYGLTNMVGFHVQGLGVYVGGSQTDPASYIPDQTCTTFRVIAVDEDGLESPPTVVR